MSMKKILIIKSKPSKLDHLLRESLAKFSENKYYIANYENVRIFYNRPEIEVWIDDVKLSDFSLVYFKSWRRYQGLATTLSHYLNDHDIPFLDKAVYLPMSGNKILQMYLLRKAGLPIPKSIFISRGMAMSNIKMIEGELGVYPVIAKDVAGQKGKNNFLIKSREELISLFENTDQSIEYLLQEFIPNDFDYRILVMGNGIGAYEKRKRRDNNTHLNNVAFGASEEFLPVESISEEVRSISVNAASLFARQIAGVDIIIHKETGKPYIIEVNPSPGIDYDTGKTPELESLVKYLDSLVSQN